jgi:hypothetical protein
LNKPLPRGFIHPIGIRRQNNIRRGAASQLADQNRRWCISRDHGALGVMRRLQHPIEHDPKRHGRINLHRTGFRPHPGASKHQGQAV